jgi:predicted PurR-regulated permease PerM
MTTLVHKLRYEEEEITMKHFSAIITALLITAVIGFGIVVIGLNALTNSNTVALQNSPNNNVSGNSLSGIGDNSAQVQQLQVQMSEMQSQLNQAGQAIQQYQSILITLQQHGLIRIDQNGNIYLSQGDTD